MNSDKVKLMWLYVQFTFLMDWKKVQAKWRNLCHSRLFWAVSFRSNSDYARCLHRNSFALTSLLGSGIEFIFIRRIIILYLSWKIFLLIWFFQLTSSFPWTNRSVLYVCQLIRTGVLWDILPAIYRTCSVLQQG